MAILRSLRLFLLVALAVSPSTGWPQGEPVGPEFRLNTFTTADQMRPSVALDASGNAVAAWDSDGQDGDLRGIFGQRYAASGVPMGPEFQVNTYTADDQISAQVASDSSGNFVVVWESRFEDGYGRGIFGQRYASSGAPLGPEFRVNTYTTGEQELPRIASDAAGNFVVVWTGETPSPPPQSNFEVFGQRFAASGAPLGSEFRVNTFTTGSQGGFSVVADPVGSFIVAWVSYDQDGSAGVFGQRFASSGSPLGPEFRVNTYTTGPQGIPQVAVDPSGNFVVVWLDGSQDGSAYGVFGQRYAGSGASLGPEFQVNTYTTGYQRPYGVATDSMGRFVVVWSGSTGDGSGFAVFGQRYSMIVPVELMHLRVE